MVLPVVLSLLQYKLTSVMWLQVLLSRSYKVWEPPQFLALLQLQFLQLLALEELCRTMYFVRMCEKLDSCRLWGDNNK